MHARGYGMIKNGGKRSDTREQNVRRAPPTDTDSHYDGGASVGNAGVFNGTNYSSAAERLHPYDVHARPTSKHVFTEHWNKDCCGSQRSRVVPEHFEFGRSLLSRR